MKRRFLVPATVELYIEAESEESARQIAEALLEKRIRSQEWGIPYYSAGWGQVNEASLGVGFTEVDEEGSPIATDEESPTNPRPVVRDERD